jgi:hypothetical protein
MFASMIATFEEGPLLSQRRPEVGGCSSIDGDWGRRGQQNRASITKPGNGMEPFELEIVDPIHVTLERSDNPGREWLWCIFLTPLIASVLA